MLENAYLVETKKNNRNDPKGHLISEWINEDIDFSKYQRKYCKGLGPENFYRLGTEV